jgi:hypothetical protein
MGRRGGLATDVWQVCHRSVAVVYQNATKTALEKALIKTQRIFYHRFTIMLKRANEFREIKLKVPRKTTTLQKDGTSHIKM